MRIVRFAIRVTACLLVCAWLHGVALWAASPAESDSPWKLDLRYAPMTWQTLIGLPDDWQKTLVSKEGVLLYDYPALDSPGGRRDFRMRIALDFGRETQWRRQELAGARLPIVRTLLACGPVEILEEAMAVAPLLPSGATAAKGDSQAASQRKEVGGEARQHPWVGPARHDLLLVRLRNTGSTEARLEPRLRIESETPVALDKSANQAIVGPITRLSGSVPFVVEESGKGRSVLGLGILAVPAGEERTLVIAVGRGSDAVPCPTDPAGAMELRKKVEQYWKHADLPYGCFDIPDDGVQRVLDSCVRNIYQAREIKKGLPAFQVGPTCYRGLWVVDGSFLMESVAYLNRVDEARSGIHYLLGFQRPDGAIMLIDGHLKETGITLWAVTRHGRLSNDKAWLEGVWPQLEKGWGYIRELRKKASDPKSPNYQLLPEGFSDGGLAGVNPEYTNVYWTLVGMKSAVDAARWLGHGQQADAWQLEYDDFYAALRRAAERDTRPDASGNRYVPINMRKDSRTSPQKAQWAFLHAIFPGKLFAAGDPLVAGNMAMMRAVEVEGLVRDTGWVRNGVWNYHGSFYAHAWLWLGDGQKAAQTLYAFGNHASPLLVWREEQMPVGEGPAVCGDMPHNWASAEFIRLVRHLLVLERGDELHLFEGLPPVWVRPGKTLRVRKILTEFGPISLELKTAADGKRTTLVLEPPVRNPAVRIVVHRDGWGGHGTFEVPADHKSETEILLPEG